MNHAEAFMLEEGGYQKKMLTGYVWLDIGVMIVLYLHTCMV